MWLEIEIFGFRALWSPYFMSFVVLVGLAYYLMTGPYRHKFGGKNEERSTVKQQIYFYVGLVILYLAIGAPVDLLSHIMLSAHMVQMVLFLFIFPIFFIQGIPAWMWRKFINIPVIKPVFNILTKPLVALLVFSALFSLYHMPAVFDYSKSSFTVHTVTLIILLILAINMWWPIVTPVEEEDTLVPLLKMGYLVVNAAIITIACALIIFASTPLFNAYSSEGSWIQAMSLCVPGDVLNNMPFELSGPEMFSPLSILDDQQLGGIIMMIMQQAVYIAMLGRIFFSWFTKESLKTDPLPDTEINSSN